MRYPVEVFTGRVQDYEESRPSAIAKVQVAGELTLTERGLAGDEQAESKIHGGPDRALCHYPREHYLHWAREFPEQEDLFVAPAFGENLSTEGLNDILRMAEEAYRVGYDAVMVLPPYYYGQTPKQLLSYFRQLGNTLSGQWFAYNFPARTGCDLTPDLIATLAAEFPHFAGIKDTVDCQSHTRSMIQATRAVREDFAVLSGYDEYYIPNLLAGGAGVFSGLNNVMPELFVSAREAFKQGDLETLREIQQNIGTYMSIYAIGDDFVSTIKTVVSRKFGYCTGVSRNAGGALNEHECRTIDEVFDIKS